MGIEITLDARAIHELDGAILRAAEQTMEALRGEVVTAQVMPNNTGTMQDTNTFTDTYQDGNKFISSLVTGGPQARRLYYHPEYNFQRVNNPNAGGEWLEPWIEGDQRDFVPDTFATRLKEEANI